MATVSGLSVRVSSSVSQFRAGMSSAQESAQDLSLSLRRLGAASSSAERDLDSAGRSATTTAGQFAALTAGTDGLNASFMGLSVVTVGALIPSLATLSTVLAPLITALGGFVTVGASVIGVIGGIVGSGLLAWGKQLSDQAKERRKEIQNEIKALQSLKEENGELDEAAQTRLKNLKEERRQLKSQTSIYGALAAELQPVKNQIIEIVATFGKQFIPLIKDAVATLPILVDDIINASEAAGGLVPTLRDLGSALADFIPELAYLATILASEFLPPFVEWAEDVLPQIPDLLRSFVDTMQETSDILGPLGSELRDMLPVLNRFGTEVLRTIVPSLTRFTRMATNAMQSVNEMDSSLQGLVIGAVILLPIFTALAGFLGGPFTAALIGVGAAFAAVAGIIAADFGGIQGLMRQLAPAVRSVGNALQQSIGTFVENLDMETINKEFSEFEDIVATQLQKNLPVARDLLQEFAQTLRDNQEEIGVLGSAAGTIIVGIIDLLGVLARIGGFVFRNVFAPGVSLVIDLIDIMLTKLANGVKLFNALQEGNFSQAAGFLEDVALGEDANVGQMAAQAGMQQVGGPQGTQTVEILLQEDTEMMNAKIQEGAENVLTETADRAKSKSGNTANL